MRTIALLSIMLVGTPALADPPSRATIRREVGRAWYADVEAWSDYAFRRHVTRQSYDADGNVTFRQEMLFQVTPGEHGFDEVLLEVDGRKPTPAEEADHREKHRFTKHYMQAGELELDNPMGEDLALRPIIQEQKHQMVGEDEVSGIPCYRTRFDAQREPKHLSPRDRLRYAIKGTTCISVDGYHVVAFDMETVREIKKLGLGMIHIEMHIEGQPVGDAWLPKRVELKSEAVVFGKHMRKSNTFRYSDFEYKPARQ